MVARTVDRPARRDRRRIRRRLPQPRRLEGNVERELQRHRSQRAPTGGPLRQRGLSGPRPESFASFPCARWSTCRPVIRASCDLVRPVQLRVRRRPVALIGLAGRSPRPRPRRARARRSRRRHRVMWEWIDTFLGRDDARPLDGHIDARAALTADLRDDRRRCGLRRRPHRVLVADAHRGDASMLDWHRW